VTPEGSSILAFPLTVCPHQGSGGGKPDPGDRQVLDEAVRERDALENECETARTALVNLESAEERADLIATLEQLQQDEQRLRERLRDLQDRRADLQGQRKKLISETDRGLELLEAQIRTAEDVVRHRVV
jgi:predicted  nucleic acid-binding Zn-ribbon protein